MEFRALVRTFSGRSHSTWRRAAFAGLALLLACELGGNRADQHLRKAETFLAEDRGREALLELHNAALLRPDDVDLGLRVAEVSIQYGFFGDAVDFYRDALALRPDDSASALKLAQLLLDIDLEESRLRIDELIARDPRNARAWLIRARADLIEGDTTAAITHISNARSIDPSEPEIERVLALTYETRGNAALARNPLAIPAPRVTQSILRAYDRYLARGGEYPLLGYLGRARTLARLPDGSEDARAAFEIALEKSRKMGTPHERIRVARASARFAQLNDDPDLAKRAVRMWIAADKRDLDAWQTLIDLEIDDPPSHRSDAYRDMIRTLPDLPTAHALYAQHLLETQGDGAAVGYLERRLGQGEDDATLLIGIANVQALAKRYKDAGHTLARLRQDFPQRPATWLALGEQQIRIEDHEAAVESLQTALAMDPSPAAYRALARAEQQRGRLEAALAAINESFARDNQVHPNGLRLRAQIQRQMGNHEGAANSLLRLRRLVGLEPGEQLSLALSYYDRDTPGIGRKILLALLEREDVGPRAALEFARYDAQNPQHRPAVRQHLTRAFEKFPRSIELLEALTEFDLADGRVAQARDRLNAAVAERNWIGRPYLIRGNLLLELGEFVAARDDAERALRLDPSTLDAAYDIMTIAYMRGGNLPGLVSAMEAKGAERGLSADRKGLLGRLNLAAGNPVRALELYDAALDEGSNLLFVKNDLAYLLASTGGDLDRALALAKAASEAPGDHISTTDTLGYVYLKQGKPDVAIWQFRHAVATAVPPVPDYFHHLGLALFELGKADQARDAFEQALALDPDFADAEAARRLLGQLGSPADEPENPGA